MAKRKRTEGQTKIYKIYLYKTKDRVKRTPLNPTKNREWTQVLWKGKQFLLH